MKIPALALTAAALFCASSALAASIDASTLDLTELQSLFDSRTAGGSSSIDVNQDESRTELFTFQSTGATATYMATISYAGDIEFGVYDPYNAMEKLVLFDNTKGAQPGDSTQIYIEYDSTVNTLISYYFDLSLMPNPYVQVDSASFQSSALGFYATSVYGTWYSESARNAAVGDINGDGVNDADHFLTYMGLGDLVDAQGIGTHLNDFAHWYIAAELTNMAGDHPSYSDYTDIVVQVESVQPVPEPATMVLLGSGLLGVAGVARRRNKG